VWGAASYDTRPIRFVRFDQVGKVGNVDNVINLIHFTHLIKHLRFGTSQFGRTRQISGSPRTRTLLISQSRPSR